MEFKEIVLKNRSYRRFDQAYPLTRRTLLELVDLARNTPSAANHQPLQYVLSCSPEVNNRIFGTLAWAGSLPDWPGPPEGERPAGYVVVVAEGSGWEWTRVDLGIAAQTILLGATARGLGGCMIGNLRKEGLKHVLGLQAGLEILLVIALGKPVEEVVLEELEEGQPVTYYRTEDRVHHVPKRRLEELVLRSYP